MHPEPSALLPGFLRKLQAPGIKPVLLAGCGGGFDSRGDAEPRGPLPVTRRRHRSTGAKRAWKKPRKP